MEPPTKKSKKNYTTWNNSERRILLQMRIKNDDLFTGKNANSSEGWRKIAAELSNELGEEKSASNCKSQWNALMKKYKSFFTYRSGEGTGEEATAEEAKDWEFFDIVHTYAATKDNYHPPYLVDSSEGELSMQRPTTSDDTPSTSRSSLQNLQPSPSLSPSPSPSPSPSLSSGSSRTPTDFQRLEQHIKKRDKKISKKISSLLAVFGQMVQVDYPHIDVSDLLLSSDSE